MYKLELSHSFGAAHKLENYVGACANLHGHTWKIDIIIETEKLINDMIVDFKDLKKIIDERFDHKYINEQVDYNPTAENISKDIYSMINKLFSERTKEDQLQPVIKVTVWESEKAGITYTE